MAGLKAKISTTIDKLTHHGKTDPNTTGTGMGHHTTGTTTGTGAGYDSTTTGTGAGYGQTGGLDTTPGTGAGYGTSTTGATGPGAGYGTSTTGATGITGGATTTTAGTGQIIDSETFTKTEDHEVLIEKKRYELEHRPVQKQYVVETKFVGETAVPGGPTEVVGTEAREVDERVRQAPAGNRTVVVENVDVPASALRNTGTTTGTGTGTTGTGTTGTGSTY